MEIKLVVFDIAGTTVVDKGVVNRAFRDALKTKEIDVPEDEINTIMGYHKADAIRRMLEHYYEGDPADVDDLVDVLLHQFSSTLIKIYRTEKMEALPFAEVLIKSLREHGIKVALNTGFTRDITDVILKNLGWMEGEFIDAVICSDEVYFGRPYPFMIRSLMKRFGLTDPSQVAKCGDTPVDIQEGKNADCGLVVGITTGAFSREDLLPYEPDAVIDSLQEFSALLNMKHAEHNR